ncbi:MAG: hypothetical protein ACP5UZ_02275 [Thermoplasmata archaeon]
MNEETGLTYLCQGTGKKFCGTYFGKMNENKVRPETCIGCSICESSLEGY